MRILRHLADLWRPGGTTGRAVYAMTGLGAFALKYGLDRLLVDHLTGWSWRLQDYWISPFGPITSFSALPERRGVTAALLCLALPFIWLGVVLTLRRLRSLGWPLWLVVVFFVPLLNLALFFLLCVLPGAAERTDTAPNRRSLATVLPGRPRTAAIASALLATLITAPPAWLAIVALGMYGWSVFVGLPFLLGFSAVLIDGQRGERPLSRGIRVSLLALALASATLLGFGLEGLICIAMALPLAAPLTLLGAVVGHWTHRALPTAAASVHVLPTLVLALPPLLWLERHQLPEPPAYSVSSAVEINASPEAVWDHVVSFDELPPPEDWVFRLGIAYPIRAEIDGAGPGAIRRCVFSTGSFVEPIEVWDEPRLLRFSVTASPPPLTELSPYRQLDLPHLHGFFVAESGEFLLEPLAGGRTRLVGATTYRHGMWPARYWSWWNDALIHRIHLRVLHHIRLLAEGAATPT